MTAPLNILIVDDEPSNLLALEAILEPLGQTVVRASSGREALVHALRMDLAVVILDVQMPGMDGFECAELLRKRSKTRDVPIIFATAISKDRAYVTKGYDVGAVDYLLKPYDPDVLRAKVAVFVDLARKNAIIQSQHEALQQMSARELAEFKQWSEQRYGDLADAMPQIVWTADPHGKITYANRRWRELAGEGGTDFAAVVHPDDLARIEAVIAPALASGSDWEVDVRFGSPAVGFRYHVARGMPRRDEADRVVSWIGTGTEMDARVRTERALRILADASRRLGAALDDPSQIEAVLRSLIPLLGDAAFLDLDREGGARRVMIVGDRMEGKTFDDPRFDLGPSTVRYSLRPEVYLDVEKELEATVSSRVDHLRFLHELGVAAYMCFPLASRGHCVGTLTLLRIGEDLDYEIDEVTLATDLANRIAVAIDNARLHEATEHRRQQLEEANRSKDVFLATLSHELRTPLNAIIGWTDMMRNGQLAPGNELDRAVETIDRNAHLLVSLVADLLDVSRIVTGTLKLDSRLVGLASVVEAAIEAARPQCTAKRVVLDVAIERVGCVMGDPARLRQVLGNLLSNAVKFTPTGGSVVVRVKRDGENGVIEVSDSGEGIAPEFLPHVFERFRQAETARARGLGLGLAIVKHLVDEHGGTVSAASEGRGKGATFTLELPIAAEETAVEDERERQSMPTLGTPELGAVHVLVVEDDPDGNELITAILERYGARVTAVGTAGAALAALDEELPDIIVSDIGLPDRDGLDLIKTVRAGGRKLPAIALTAYASKQDAAKALSAGFDAHVAKPVQPATLGSAIVRLLENVHEHPSAETNGAPKRTDARSN